MPRRNDPAAEGIQAAAEERAAAIAQEQTPEAPPTKIDVRITGTYNRYVL